MVLLRNPNTDAQLYAAGFMLWCVMATPAALDAAAEALEEELESEKEEEKEFPSPTTFEITMFHSSTPCPDDGTHDVPSVADWWPLLAGLRVSVDEDRLLNRDLRLKSSR